jgi:Fe-S-cluster-containing dehydrogenase component/formate-dependent nitrite reductase membrane component NrfD
MNYGFIIDNRKCIGCHACTVACKAEHNVPLGVNRTWVKYIEKGQYPHTRRLFTVMRCNHCADAPCVEICPVTALYTRPDGIVDFNNDRCIGCKACTQACPYDALYIDPNLHTAAKCNYCTHRIETGLEPACVIVCPVHAIISGDLDDSSTEIAQLLASEPVQVRKPEKNTRPHLFYIDGDEAALTPTLASRDSDYMWSSQSGKVGHGLKSENVGGPGGDADDSFLTTLLRYPEKFSANSESEPQFAHKSAEIGIEKSRRAYDVPSEGVMWGWEVAAYVWTKAIAAGVVLVPFLAAGLGLSNESPAVALTSVIFSICFLGFTGALLVIDLDRPERFFYVLIRPQWRSWLTRGAYIITIYGALLSIWAFTDIFGLVIVRDWLHWPIILFASLTAIYTGFLFAQAKGRDFWQDPTIVLQMLVHAFGAGSAGLLLLSMVLPIIGFDRPLLLQTLLWSLMVSALLLIFELWTTHPTLDGEQAKRSITRGVFAPLFWLGIAGAGLLLPMLLLVTGSTIFAAIAALLTLGGLFLHEHIWVRAPQLLPLS